MKEDTTDEETSDWIHDEVTGVKKKLRSTMLNKETLSKYELDELFLDDN